jgi:peptide-methionine (S)-S-oxide reductase
MRKAQLQKGTSQLDVATLGGGCFWCTEAIFSHVKGVVKVESGYSGGHLANPTYQQVSTGTTGYAEVLQITFDPKLVSFQELLEIFFDTHDPTTMNRQGNDMGTQYRSVIFYHDSRQQAIAQEYIARLGKSKKFLAPIVTAVEPFTTFYKAEDYHRDYFQRHPDEDYSRFIIAPKLVKFRKHFPQKLRSASSDKKHSKPMR